MQELLASARALLPTTEAPYVTSQLEVPVPGPGKELAGARE
ncbi:hypothetical protein OG905_00610 [Streptomyces sp. NBC_00322]|nr:hypothetical protein [Streptomyces sp. NBC_00322]